MTKLLNQSEYARLKGVSSAHINRLVKKGIIKLDRGKINSNEADKSIEEYSDHAPGEGHWRDSGIRATQDSDTDSYAHYKKIKIKIEIANEKLKYDEKMGILLNAEELKTKHIKAVVDVKTRLLAVSHKCSQEIAHILISGKSETEIVIEVSKILKKEHEEALRELSQWGSKKGGDIENQK